MRTKMVGFLTAFIIMLFIIIVNTFNVAAEKYEFKVSVDDKVNIGHSFSIVLSMNGSTDISALQFNVMYNSEFLSFKNAESLQPGEINFFDSNGTLSVISLFDDSLKDGDAIVLNFTAKTGNASSNQTISFVFIQAVDTNLNDVNISFSNNAQLSIIKNTENSSSGNSKDRNLNQSYDSDRKNKNVSSSKSSSSKVIQKYAEGNESDYTKNGRSSLGENGGLKNQDDSTASLAEFDNINNTGNLNLEDNKATYFIAGVGGTISVIGILSVVFRLGQLSKRKPDSERIFPKDDDKYK